MSVVEYAERLVLAGRTRIDVSTYTIPDIVVPRNFKYALVYADEMLVSRGGIDELAIAVLLNRGRARADPEAGQHLFCERRVAVLVFAVHNLIAVQVIDRGAGQLGELVISPVAAQNQVIRILKPEIRDHVLVEQKHVSKVISRDVERTDCEEMLAAHRQVAVELLIPVGLRRVDHRQLIYFVEEALGRVVEHMHIASLLQVVCVVAGHQILTRRVVALD